jgi:hypothetical protein
VDREKRKGDISIPENLEEMLNEAQRQALPGIKCSGWEPRFLRKPLFQAPLLVVHNSNDGRIGVFDEEGKIRIQANIKVREQESQTQTPSPSNPLVWTK